MKMQPYQGANLGSGWLTENIYAPTRVFPDPRLILKVEPEDVLLGRGSAYAKHPGNASLRKKVQELADDYKLACRGSKKFIAEKVMNAVHETNGRFICKCSEYTWYEVDRRATMEKIAQALRREKITNPHGRVESPGAEEMRSQQEQPEQPPMKTVQADGSGTADDVLVPLQPAAGHSTNKSQQLVACSSQSDKIPDSVAEQRAAKLACTVPDHGISESAASPRGSSNSNGIMQLKTVAPSDSNDYKSKSGPGVSALEGGRGQKPSTGSMLSNLGGRSNSPRGSEQDFVSHSASELSETSQGEGMLTEAEVLKQIGGA